ncbi:MAG: hypothetical protein M3Y67_08005, partial [Pseudomonadota bacterium]|nr:hypothetical protein [Pseudomonadota bacterium]
MNLDLNTLLYACIAVTALAAAVMSFFGSIQGTHPGYRWWVGAQWMLVGGLLLSAVFGANPAAATAAGLLIVQWPIVVLAGMRLLHLRNRPAVAPAFDWALLGLAGGLLVVAWAAEVGAMRSIA